MSAPRLVTIAAGSVIVATPAAITRGMLGPIMVQPDTGKLFSLTAAQAVWGAETISVADGAGLATIVSVGTPHFAFSDGVWSQADEMIAVVPLTNFVLIERARSSGLARGKDHAYRAPEIVASPWSHLGGDVVIATRRGPSIGRLCCVDGHFLMPRLSDDVPTIFDNALEIRGRSDAPLVMRGDAGSLVTTRDGAWLGIVVAADDGTVFAAPLGRKALHQGLIIPTDGAIGRQNARVADFAERANDTWILRPARPLPSRNRPGLPPERAGHHSREIAEANLVADYLLGADANGE